MSKVDYKQASAKAGSALITRKRIPKKPPVVLSPPQKQEDVVVVSASEVKALKLVNQIRSSNTDAEAQRKSYWAIQSLHWRAYVVAAIGEQRSAFLFDAALGTSAAASEDKLAKDLLLADRNVTYTYSEREYILKLIWFLKTDRIPQVKQARDAVSSKLQSYAGEETISPCSSHRHMLTLQRTKKHPCEWIFSLFRDAHSHSEAVLNAGVASLCQVLADVIPRQAVIKRSSVAEGFKRLPLELRNVCLERVTRHKTDERIKVSGLYEWVNSTELEAAYNATMKRVWEVMKLSSSEGARACRALFNDSDRGGLFGVNMQDLGIRSNSLSKTWPSYAAITNTRYTAGYQEFDTLLSLLFPTASLRYLFSAVLQDALQSSDRLCRIAAFLPKVVRAHKSQQLSNEEYHYLEMAHHTWGAAGTTTGSPSLSSMSTASPRTPLRSQEEQDLDLSTHLLPSRHLLFRTLINHLLIKVMMS